MVKQMVQMYITGHTSGFFGTMDISVKENRFQSLWGDFFGYVLIMWD